MMRIKIIICILLFPCMLYAQRVNKHGQKLNKWGIIIEENTASEEKIYLTKTELNALTVPDEACDLFESKNSDTIVFNDIKYIISRTPITALIDKSIYMLYEDDEIGLNVPLTKKYILNWEIKNDSLLYIVDYNMAPDYQGKKTKEDVRKEIERLWMKKFRNGELNVDWMIVKDAPKTTIQMLVRDSNLNVYCLTFEDGKFVKIEEKNNIIVRKTQ